MRPFLFLAENIKVLYLFVFQSFTVLLCAMFARGCRLLWWF